MGFAFFCTELVLQPVCCVYRVWFVAISEELNYTTDFERMSTCCNRFAILLAADLSEPPGKCGRKPCRYTDRVPGPDGEIGRHSGLKIRRPQQAYRFKSGSGHQGRPG
jgi:hypothetical protein